MQASTAAFGVLFTVGTIAGLIRYQFSMCVHAHVEVSTNKHLCADITVLIVS